VDALVVGVRQHELVVDAVRLAPELLVAHGDLAVDLRGPALGLPVALAHARVDRGRVDDRLDLVELLAAEVREQRGLPLGDELERVGRAELRGGLALGVLRAPLALQHRPGRPPGRRAGDEPSDLGVAGAETQLAQDRRVRAGLGAGPRRGVDVDGRLRVGGAGAFGRRPGDGSLAHCWCVERAPPRAWI
jgi:hypothetical protein